LARFLEITLCVDRENFVRNPTLLFDLDGTLVDTATDLAHALNHTLVAEGFAPFSEAEVKAMVGDGVAMLLRRALAKRGAAFSPALVPVFLAEYEQHVADASRLYPGVAETLQKLKRDGWILAVCTNKPLRAAERLLSTLGIAQDLAAIGAADLVKARKPDPAHVRATLALAGGEAARAVLLGDHANDVAAGRAAGVPVIFAAWGYGQPEMAEGAAARAEHFSEVPALADRVLGQRAQVDQD
jgi:phosphoglycolate phosphatase